MSRLFMASAQTSTSSFLPAPTVEKRGIDGLVKRSTTRRRREQSSHQLQSGPSEREEISRRARGIQPRIHCVPLAMGVGLSTRGQGREKDDGLRGEGQSTRPVKLQRQSTEGERQSPVETREERSQYFHLYGGVYDSLRGGQTIN